MKRPIHPSQKLLEHGKNVEVPPYLLSHVFSLHQRKAKDKKKKLMVKLAVLLSPAFCAFLFSYYYVLIPSNPGALFNQRSPASTRLRLSEIATELQETNYIFLNETERELIIVPEYDYNGRTFKTPQITVPAKQKVTHLILAPLGSQLRFSSSRHERFTRIHGEKTSEITLTR